MPVESHHLDRRVVLRTEVTAPRSGDDPQQQPNSDHHVQRMQSGQSPIKNHEQLHFRRERRILMPREVRSGKKTFIPVRVIFVTLDAEKDAAEKERGDQHHHGAHSASEL